MSNQLKTSDAVADRLAELERAATKGPWWRTDPPWGHCTTIHAGPSDDPHTATTYVADCYLPEDGDAELAKPNRPEADAEFIAEARNSLPGLLQDRATAARLLRAVERVRARRDHYAERFAESPSLFDHDMVEELGEVLAILDGEDETRKEAPDGE